MRYHGVTYFRQMFRGAINAVSWCHLLLTDVQRSYKSGIMVSLTSDRCSEELYMWYHGVTYFRQMFRGAINAVSWCHLLPTDVQRSYKCGIIVSLTSDRCSQEL